MASLTALLLRLGHKDTHVGVPVEILTGTGAAPAPRVRVDQRQTSFAEGRQFRVLHEFNIASGASAWLRFVLAGDVVALRRELTVVQGNLRYGVGTGVTAGTWTAKSIFPVNAMANAPVYAPSTAVSTGGSATGLIERDVQILETGSANSVTVQSVADESGYSAGTYYAEIRNTGGTALRGLYTLIFEEYQPRSPLIYG